MLHGTIRALKRTVQAMHSCKALYIKSVPVHEVVAGRTIWEGEVAIFNIQRHPNATRCYAWSSDDGNETKSIAVLAIPPVDSAESAVTVAIAAQAKIA